MLSEAALQHESRFVSQLQHGQFKYWNEQPLEWTIDLFKQLHDDYDNYFNAIDLRIEHGFSKFIQEDSVHK